MFGQRLTGVGTALMPWIVPISVACYLIVAVLAQVRLDVLRNLF